MEVAMGRIDRLLGTYEIEPQNRRIGKGCNRMASYPFRIPFMTMQIEIMTGSSIISRTIRCLRVRIGVIHDDMRTGIRIGTNQVKIHLVECPLDLKQIQNGFAQ